MNHNRDPGWSPFPFGKYTAQPKPETMLRDLPSWEDQVLPDPDQQDPEGSRYEQLSATTRCRILKMRHSDGLTVQQISARLGISMRRIDAVLFPGRPKEDL